MRRLRILFLIDNALADGGAERFAVGLATHLPRDRFEVWVCSTRTAETVAQAALERAGVRHINLGRRTKWDVHRFRALVRLLRRRDFDILHAHMFGSNVWGSIIGRACGVPVIIAHEHNWSYSGNRLRIAVDRHLIGRAATLLVAVSDANRQRMVSLERIPPEKIVVLPTAYVPSPEVSSTDLFSELGLSRESPLVGTAAVLRQEKALEILLEAHARVARRFDRAQLVIAGDGPCRAELERRARELGIAGRVHFLGFRADVDSILQALDLGVLSSDWEGMPLFVCECMAAGTALVATAVGGVPEIVQDGRTGVLVPPRDPVALADAIASLLSDADRRTRLAAAASGRIGEFSIDAGAARFAALYDELVGSARRREVVPACTPAGP
jgi:glycosyltransferase involved in cell wall biosynthesis